MWPSLLVFAEFSLLFRFFFCHFLKECRPCKFWQAVERLTALHRERKMRKNFFYTHFLNTPGNPGHPGKIPGTWQIPLFETPRKTNFQGRARTFRPPPLRVEDPHPTGRAPDLSGLHRSTHIASDLASRALASQAKPQRESESQAFRIARS